MPKSLGLPFFVLLLWLWGCGGGSTVNTPPPPRIAFSLSASTLKFFQSGQTGTVTVNINVTRNGSAGSLSASVAPLPSGATAQSSGLGSGSTGSLTITPGTASAGTYNLTVTLTDGQTTSTQPLQLTIGVFATIDTASTGQLALAMSTSFQPAEWDYQFFQNFPGAVAPLTALGPQHIRIQAVSQGVPQTSATTWDFSTLNAILNPVFTAADHSPEFQIAVAPAFMDDSNGHLTPANFQAFAGYSANLVRYFNTGGFTAPDGMHASTSGFPIIYWGIFNEPNVNGVTSTGYTDLYNMTVPAMQAVDPTIKFVAIELADFNGQNTSFVPEFVSGVTAQVDVVATHFYSTCNQKDSDATLFATVPDFANRVSYLYSELQTNPALVNVPVWITENNVNADYNKGNGISACNGTTFVTDARGSSAFFAAWRPYMFSQMAKAGARALYHWDFAADAQYGEVDDQTGKPRLSYWVDYWLEHYFPSPPGATLLHYSTTDDAEVETLAARNPDGSVVLMIANRAVASSSDDNGAGAPRAVLIDISQIGNFSSAKLLTIDANADLVNGPSESAVPLTPRIEVDFAGYGVAFLTLK